jgi:hypothetical protein
MPEVLIVFQIQYCYGAWAKRPVIRKTHGFQFVIPALIRGALAQCISSR